MSISTLFPTYRPKLLLDFVRSNRLDPRITFTRASGATRIGPHGRIELVGNDVPRFDYDPVTGACRGLLIEGQNTNVLTYSEQIDHANWTKSGVTATANATTAPDGTTTAEAIIPTAVSSAHYISQNYTYASGTTYTFSIFAKANGYSVLQMAFSGTAFSALPLVDFNVSTGVVALQSNVVSASMAAMADGWWRCTVTITSDGAGTLGFFWGVYETGTPGRLVAYTGNGTSGLFIWGAQLEVAAWPSSYIPTVASSVVRTQDVATLGGAPFAAFYNQDEWTMVAEYAPSRQGGVGPTIHTPHVFGFNNSNTAGFDGYGARVAHNLTTQPSIIGRHGAGIPGASVTYGAYPNAGQVYRLAAAMSSSGIAISADGKNTAVGTNTIFGLDTQNQLLIGTADTGGSSPYQLYSHMRRFAYYDKRLPNEALQLLSR